MLGSYTIEEDVESSSTNLPTNDSIKSFSWSNINVQVKNRTSKISSTILDSCSGVANAGEVVALMGPSGSGKTTLLNALAHRLKLPWQGDTYADGNRLSSDHLRKISSYVEQDDALVGSLTVRETIEFAYKLALPSLGKAARQEMTDSLVAAFGLQEQENSLIGTPIRKGISGGQKRRTSVAAQLVTSPKILFLDEPTSGLDSAASYEVMRFISSVAKKHKLIVIASIHQPSTTTFELFDCLLLLSKGKTCYFGPVKDVRSYFNVLAPVPPHINPAEFLLDLVNTDFTTTRNAAQLNILQVLDHWAQSTNRHTLPEIELNTTEDFTALPSKPNHINVIRIAFILLHRNWIKSHRDYLAYGTRIAMYMGLAIMMGTVWLRLPYTQTSIQPFVNAIFFSGAFMSFMAVAYVPSVIEDLDTFHKEHANGLTNPISFILANFLIGIPWLLTITLLFSVITYWLCNFRPGAAGFWQYVLWLYLDLLAAEGLVVLISSTVPIFVVALAATAFANGLWMSVGGFLVPLGSLNVFWKYVFHYIDYQAYVFQAMMVNQFKDTTYACDDIGDGYHCMLPSELESQGQLPGMAVLRAYGYSYASTKNWQWFGIMIAIIVAYRILGYIVLVLKTKKL